MGENADLAAVPFPEPEQEPVSAAGSAAAPASAPKAAEPRAAGAVLRTGAFAIDAGLVAVAAWAWDFGVWRVAPLAAPKLVPLGIVLMINGYYGWFTARHYHTPGQGFAGLTLARTDYQPLTSRRAYWRSVLFFATSGMALPNLLLMLLDRRGRTIHDWATKTWVYSLPGFDRRRRVLTVVAAVLLAVLATARLALTVSDALEGQSRLTFTEIAEGADAQAR